MLAERLPGILPPLDDDAAMEVTAIRSLCSAGEALTELVREPPFEAPHHSASAPAILGGGSGIPRPRMRFQSAPRRTLSRRSARV